MAITASYCDFVVIFGSFPKQKGAQKNIVLM
jgi:hypothetical protein